MLLLLLLHCLDDKVFTDMLLISC